MIELPPWFVAENGPEVVRLVHLANRRRSNADPDLRKRFLHLATFPAEHPDILQSNDSPATCGLSETRPDLAAIRSARVPSAIVSGDHSPGIERICDALREGVGGERMVLRGAGLAVQRTPEFKGWLASVLANAMRRGRG